MGEKGLSASTASGRWEASVEGHWEEALGGGEGAASHVLAGPCGLQPFSQRLDAIRAWRICGLPTSVHVGGERFRGVSGAAVLCEIAVVRK